MIAIYKITSPTNKVYIGQSRNVRKRFTAYKNVKEIGKQKKVFASLLKYGSAAHKFEIVHELPKDVDQETLTRYEQIYMDQYRDCGFNMLNLCPVANSQSGNKWSEESKRRKSDRMKGKPSGRKGAKLSEEHKQKMSLARKGVKQSQETKDKRAAAMRGKKRGPMPREAVEKMRLSKLGRKLTEEHKLKVSQNNSRHFLGKVHSEETKAKMSKAWEKRKLLPNPIVGIKRSDEERAARSLTMKGKPSPMQGKKHSEETKEKIRQIKKGGKLTAEHKSKISETLKNKKR